MTEAETVFRLSCMINPGCNARTPVSKFSSCIALKTGPYLER